MSLWVEYIISSRRLTALNVFKTGNYEQMRSVRSSHLPQLFFSFLFQIQSQFALKIDRREDVHTVHREVRVLQSLTKGHRFCRVHHFGYYKGLRFMVMDLLGPNLAEIRHQHFLHVKMPIKMVKHIALSLLSAIEALHAEGYVHRDVKPANFVLTSPDDIMAQGDWTLIDFGLSKTYLDDNNRPLSERKNCGFRGSTTYASINAHDNRDLGRRDDIWGWIYTIIELLDGKLPWRSDRDAIIAENGYSTECIRKIVGKRKRSCAGNPKEFFTSGKCPKALKDVIDHMVTLKFEDKPDYLFLRSKIEELETEASQMESVEEKSAPAREIIDENLDRSSCNEISISNSNHEMKVKPQDIDTSLRRTKRSRYENWNGDSSGRSTTCISDSIAKKDSDPLLETNWTTSDSEKDPNKGKKNSIAESFPQDPSDLTNLLRMITSKRNPSQRPIAIDQRRDVKAFGAWHVIINDLIAHINRKQAAELAPFFEEIAKFAQMSANRCRFKALKKDD